MLIWKPNVSKPSAKETPPQADGVYAALIKNCAKYGNLIFMNLLCRVSLDRAYSFNHIRRVRNGKDCCRQLLFLAASDS